MPTTVGPLACGTGADDATVGAVTWLSPGNITADDATYSTAVLVTNQSHYLKATNFGHSIPAGATIQGVAYGIKRKASGSGITDTVVRFVNTGTIGTVNRSAGAAWPTTEATASFGGSSDTWDGSLTPTVINASTTGVVFSCTASGSVTALANYVTSTVTYLLGGMTFYQRRTLQGGFFCAGDGVN